VREIIQVRFQGIGADIVLTHLDVRQLNRGQEARVDVGCHNSSLGANLLG
jgi:hypothetical protein